MAWWDRSDRQERPRLRDRQERPRLRDRLRSVFEERFEQPTGPVKMIVRQGEGRILGYELPDGTFIEMKPCCDDPASCTREECWTRIGELPR
jgi:hypothetical protein